MKMAIPIELLRENAVNLEIRDVLLNLVLPVGMSFESWLSQLLDTYESAQKKFNIDKPAGQKLNFISGVQASNPQFGEDASKYLLTKTYTIRATVGTTLSTVEPAKQ